ncbi:hypothetical protein AKJ62_01120 [candidate division MSBL1 archaeon SCGC-AAA259D14]|uniref:MCM domain-containing protein n=1 Tax=candidate division MSBL1 archaeon SCGC-AAA259D14 TaxID=1698261 RepID=A0A133U838_9EURY|nr:hypothetical protein AKJ62_01120 [candidate division MSBL1 archaeon SCGC-AAA259D14]
MIVGYNAIKHRFRRALKSRSIRQSILLVGPTASAKTLFLEEVARLKGVIRITGKSVTAAGFEDKVMQRPNFIIIDEYDELDGEGYSELLNYQDPKQPFEIVKSGKMDKISTEEKAPIFANANKLTRPSQPNLDRFWIFRFQRYSDEEFKMVCKRLLPQDFEISEELALYIAKKLRNRSKDSTVRDAERIAEVTETEEDVDEEIRVLKNISARKAAEDSNCREGEAG